MSATAVPAAGEPILRVCEATRRYGGVMAVQDVSFDVFEGEILGLIGPNGAGKTTLVNLITGTVKPTRGVVTFLGATLTGLAPHRIGARGIARTFQVVRPFLNLTVLENVAVGAMYGAGGHRRSIKQAFEKAEEVLAFVHLSQRRHDSADSLTIGGRKRLELAKALAMEPRLLLLDEVMAGLRGAEVNEAMTLVRAIHARGITMLVIEHVMKVIMGLCSRIMVLDYGRKIAEGTPAEVTNDPAVIRAYLGDRYVNARPSAKSPAPSAADSPSPSGRGSG